MTESVNGSLSATKGWRQLDRYGAFFYVCLVAIAAWGMSTLLRFSRHHQIDDAFITYVYSRSLAKGEGPVFSGGEVVEATSSMLWAVLLVPFELVGVGAPLGATLLGVTFAVLTSFLTWKLAVEAMNTAERSWGWPLLSVALLASCSSFALWSVYGLENSLVAFLLVWLCLSTTAAVKGRSIGPSVVAAVLLLTARPEGFVFVVVQGSFLIGRSLLGKEAYARRLAWRWCAMVVIFGGALFLARHAYYAAWLPNTVAVKVPGKDVLGFIKNGVAYLLSPVTIPNTILASGALLYTGWLMLAAASPASPEGLRSRLARWCDTEVALILATLFTAAQLVFIIGVGGDWMPNARFVSHVMPLASVAAAVAIGKLGGKLGGHRVAIAATVLLLYFVSNVAVTTHLEHGVLKQYDSSAPHAGVHAVANYLNRVAGPTDAVAMSDIGWVSYQFVGRVIDWWGLANREIATRGEGAGKIRPETILRLRPRFVVLYSNGPNLTLETAGTGLALYSVRFLQSADFIKQYRQVFSTVIWSGLHYTVWEARKP